LCFQPCLHDFFRDPMIRDEPQPVRLATGHVSRHVKSQTAGIRDEASQEKKKKNPSPDFWLADTNHILAIVVCACLRTTFAMSRVPAVRAG
jgi:hypothetical protein